MSEESNANPDWDMTEAAEKLHSRVKDKLGIDLSDDTVLRCLTIVQNSMDVLLGTASRLELPVVVQTRLAHHLDEAADEFVMDIFDSLAIGSTWTSDG